MASRNTANSKTKKGKKKKNRGFAGFVTIVVLIIAVCILSAISRHSSGNGLIISEVISKNAGAVCDSDGKYYDCIELWNTSDKPVSLKGLGLTDSAGAARYTFTDGTLQPGEVHLLLCNKSVEFSLKAAGGETLRLVTAGGRTLSQVTMEKLAQNYAMYWNGSEYIVTSEISPGYPNTEEGRDSYLAAHTAENPALVISEAVTNNLTVIPGGAQLVEVMNVSNRELDLSDFWISDDSTSIFRYQLPAETLAPGQVRLFTFGAEGSDGDFRFAKDECVVLSDCNGIIMSCLDADIPTDCSASYLADGGYEITSEPTVGFENTKEGRQAYRKAHPMDSLIISEVLNWNKKYLASGKNYYDIIEIRNTSSSTVNLADYSLSDSLDNLFRAPLSGTLEAGKYKVYVCSRDGGTPPSGYTMLPISLAKSGESVILSKNGVAVQTMYVPQMAVSQSYGLASSGEYGILASVTLGSANSDVAKKSASIEASEKGGVYNDVKKVDVVLTAKGTIHYTLDCTEPTEKSPVYSGPISFTKTGVIRAKAYESGCAASDEFVATYVINENHTMEVACLVSSPDGLFSYNRGILVDGPGAAPESPHRGANYWKGWEREATVSFYANDGTSFSEPCGLKVFGGYSKALPQKSLRVIFRAKYGCSKLYYPLFGDRSLDEYNTFIFRSGGQDSRNAHMRDALTTAMAHDYLDQILVQDYRPVVLYLNGEYYGVYYIREKINEDFVGGKCNADPSTVSITAQTAYSSKRFQELISYCKSHSLAVKENYDYVLSQVNTESYVNYMITEMWCNNFDIGNVRYFRTPDYDDGRWHWILYDVDWSMHNASRNSVTALMTDISVYNAPVFRALLGNKEFKDYFLTELARQTNEIWTTENVNAYVDKFLDIIGDEMVRHCKRWDMSYSSWQSQVQVIREFPSKRPSYLYTQVKDYFKLSDSQMQAYGFKK